MLDHLFPKWERFLKTYHLKNGKQWVTPFVLSVGGNDVFLIAIEGQTPPKRNSRGGVIRKFIQSMIQAHQIKVYW